MPAFDRRITAARVDLAARSLEGLVAAPRYAEGVPARIIEAVAPVRLAPRPDAALETEALFGEDLTVYDEDAEGWAWVQLARDQYVGYVPVNAILKAAPRPPTHRVTALRSFVFPGPTIKEPPVTWVSLGSDLVVTREIEANGRRFAILETGGAVVAQHIAPVTALAADPVAVAEMFLGTPYLWGGKSSLGIDCSGLVQTACRAAGIDLPRDSDMQEASAGVAVDLDPAGWRRGDILCWPGHVAFVRDAATMLHANAHHMATAIEPLGPGLARIAAAGTALRSVRRVL